MIDLSTSWLGLRLSTPIVCSSSPLTEHLGIIRHMEDAGAGAIVLHSLFEEQLTAEGHDLDRFLSIGDTHAESSSYFPDMGTYNLGPEGYLEHVRKAREAVDIPVIASLNGLTPGGWIEYARLLEKAGASAIELNIYRIPTDPDESSEDVERGYEELVSLVRTAVRLPVAVKLGPYFTAPAHLARRLDAAGANGLVLFNRFYQPDFDLELLDVRPRLQFSTAQELLLRLHWVAILHGHLGCDLAVTGGVHGAADVLKSIMAGAKIAMMTSALLERGVQHVSVVRDELLRWMSEHEYESIRQMLGSLSYRNVPDPSAFERANYLRVLRSHALRMAKPLKAGRVN
jgi:dihydroorotate dehydrogenase (fumarate)